MDQNSLPEVASFLIRFVHDQPRAAGGAAYHGIVRHIQTDHELIFSCWEEVENFIQQVIPLKSLNKKE